MPSIIHPMKHYHAIIIGGGGGLKLRPLTDFGHKIAIIEKEDLGGTCLNRGCIPSKMLIHPADLLKELNEYKKYHITLPGEASIDVMALTKEVTARVSENAKKIAAAYEKNENIDFYSGHARFSSDKVVEVNGEKISADRIFIATGTRPYIPNIPGLKNTPFWTSREALRPEFVPKSMIVLGGGYIGVELGHFYDATGTEVIFLVRGQFLKNEDETMIERFTTAFSEEHHVMQGVSPKEVTYDGNEFTVKLTDGQELRSEALLVATGIQPNTDDLGLENTSIELTNKKFIQADGHMRTSVEGVYALGDVTGRYFFRHSVNFEGEYLMRTLYQNPSNEQISYPAMPHAVFTNPQVAGVGETEQSLKDSGLDYAVGLNDYMDSAMGGDVLQNKHGFVKLLFDRGTRKLLGAHIMGPEASSLIHICIAFINMGATLEDMRRDIIYIHPALPEVLRNAARKVDL